MVTVFPDTVAIEVFELVYVNAPELGEEGLVKRKEESPNVFVGILKFVIVGIALFIVRVVVADAIE